MNHSKTVNSIEELSECIWYRYQSGGMGGDGMASVERGQGLPLPDTLISRWFCKGSTTGYSWTHQQVWWHLWKMIFKRRKEGIFYFFIFYFFKSEKQQCEHQCVEKKREEVLQVLKQRISWRRPWQNEGSVQCSESVQSQMEVTQCTWDAMLHSKGTCIILSSSDRKQTNKKKDWRTLTLVSCLHHQCFKNSFYNWMVVTLHSGDGDEIINHSEILRQIFWR